MGIAKQDFSDARLSSRTRFELFMEDWRRHFDPPLPTDEKFVELVRANLEEAHKGALIELGLWVENTCKKCGCDVNDRTVGCGVCIDRHHRFKKKGLPYITGEEVPKFCSGCGCHVDHYTHGCARCSSRHTMRRLCNRNGQLPPRKNFIKGHCASCHKPLNECEQTKCVRGQSRIRTRKARAKAKQENKNHSNIGRQDG
jgi:hypothetical protein